MNLKRNDNLSNKTNKTSWIKRVNTLHVRRTELTNQTIESGLKEQLVFSQKNATGIVISELGSSGSTIY